MVENQRREADQVSNVATVYNSATEQFFLDSESVIYRIEETLYRYALTEPDNASRIALDMSEAASKSGIF